MSSTKNIAKNSLFLYLRMFLNMGVGLFTAGIVLNTLGISDYGIYNIVGGFVSMFGFLNASMSSATQRFLSFDLGKNDTEQLRKTFSSAVTIHFAIALIIVLVLETFGLWYINNKLNVPTNRMTAVNVVFHFSVLSSFFNIIQVPYNALITAHERFNVYAYISFVEIAFKLLILYLLINIEHDKLILYSVLLFVSSFIIRMIYRIYCRTHFAESRYQFYYDKNYFKTLLAFTGWNLFGEVAGVARGQGNNLLLNIFFGTTMNAAYGITAQVQGVVSSFVSNFQVAVNPQIVKTYSNNDREKTLFLMKESAKFSYYLMLIIALPIVFNLEYILSLWLKKYPDYTLGFIYLSIVGILIDTVSNPLMMGAKATGNIKWYQIIIGTLIFLCFPLSYLGLRWTKDPNIIFMIIIIINLLSLGFRLYFLKKIMKLNALSFMKDVLLNIIFCTVIILGSLYFIEKEVGKADSIFSLVYLSAIVLSVSAIIIYFLGFTKRETAFIKSLIIKKK
ncbi:MATE family efflux transporter [Kaistella sp.]|uniref:MATE family efflux transporter n=1 Tax=Kaistella sp. TaxID=2782235 RepID=UPI0035A1A087